MDMTYTCDKCGKFLNFNPAGEHKDKVGYNEEYVYCNECVEEEE